MPNRKRIDVLDDIFSPEKAALVRLKSNLLTQVVKTAKPYTQVRLAKVLGEHQPRISDLMNGKVSKFSLDTLVLYAQKLGLKPVRVQLRAAA